MTYKEQLKQNKVGFAIIAAIWVVIVYALIPHNKYKDEYNPQGEMHPPLEESDSLQDWVSKHCDKETNEIKDQIIWYSEYNGVKPEAVFAISWADTQCGKHLTESFNYGNVGMTDRGGRVWYENAYEGWTALVDALNNKYMGGLEKVGHLSQGGRNNMEVKHNCPDAPAPYKCYASSPFNHNANVLRALRVMYQDNSINEHFNFRM
jgi:hypothetical protein